MGLGHDEPFGLQRPDGLTHRHAADPELAGEFHLVQRLTRLEDSGDDGLAQHAGHNARDAPSVLQGLISYWTQIA